MAIIGSIEGSIALVTGASRGIGKAIATELGRLGATVIGTATTDNNADGITTNLNNLKIKGCGMRLNVNNTENINNTIATITEEFGAPTILINNAGITKDNLLLRMQESDWDDVISTNLTSIYHTCKACIKSMVKARSGRIINISSVAACLGNAGQSNYAASKAGMEAFTRSLARELGGRNITVNAIAPGFIETDMTQILPEEHKKNMLAHIPLRRFGKAKDIASLVAFLSGEQANYITGQTMHINGGMYL